MQVEFESKEGLQIHKEFLNAWLNGKEIQVDFGGGSWITIDNPPFNKDSTYRIKPEKVIIPFTHKTIIPYLDRWIKRNDDDEQLCNKIIGFDHKGIYDQDSFYAYNSLLEEFVFVDNGKPCGYEQED